MPALRRAFALLAVLRSAPAFDPGGDGWRRYPPRPWRLGPRWLAALRERAYVGGRAGQARGTTDRAV